MVGRFLRNRRYRYRVTDGSESHPYPKIDYPNSKSIRPEPLSNPSAPCWATDSS